LAISGTVGVVGLLLAFLPQINSDGAAWRTTLEVVGVLCVLTSCVINVCILMVRLRSAGVIGGQDPSVRSGRPRRLGQYLGLIYRDDGSWRPGPSRPRPEPLQASIPDEDSDHQRW